MAALSDIIIRHELRPCHVDGKKALFHMWFNVSNVIPPSPMVGGHSGGQVSYPMGIVEFEDGTVKQVFPSQVKFVDGVINEYIFRKEVSEDD